MSGLTAAALTLVGAIAILNLALTLAVIRRLRGMSTGHSGHDDTADEPLLPPVGFTVGPLPQATHDLTGGRHTVVMVSPTCPPCKTMLGVLESNPDSYAHDALVCVVGLPEDRAPIAARLPGYQVISVTDELAEAAFQAKGFPAVISLEDGVVTRAAHALPVRV